MNYLGRKEAGLEVLVGQWGQSLWRHQSLLPQATVSHISPDVQPTPPKRWWNQDSLLHPVLFLLLLLYLKHAPPVIRATFNFKSKVICGWLILICTGANNGFSLHVFFFFIPWCVSAWCINRQHKLIASYLLFCQTKLAKFTQFLHTGHVCYPPQYFFLACHPFGMTLG